MSLKYQLLMEDDIERVLWSADDISNRVSELAAQLNHDLSAESSTHMPVFVGVATGAFIFLADLVRRISFPVSVDLVRVSSYGCDTFSNGSPTISSDLKLDISGKHVVLKVSYSVSFGALMELMDFLLPSPHEIYRFDPQKVEDIVDTGFTLLRLIEHLKLKGASSVSVCTFLDKPSRRKVAVEVVGKGKFYRGFECPDHFVVGYGMDFAELYRNLPYVGILKPRCYQRIEQEQPKN